MTAELSAPRLIRAGLVDPPEGGAPGVEPRVLAASEISAARNLASFLVALLFAVLVLLAAGALALLIATTFYGYGGIA
jgi:hypothetical protein